MGTWPQRRRSGFIAVFPFLIASYRLYPDNQLIDTSSLLSVGALHRLAVFGLIVQFDYAACALIL